MSYNLSSLGGVDINQTNNDLLGMEEVVRLVAEFVANEIANWLRDNGISVTDSLAQSIAALPVEFDLNSASFKVVGEEYFSYIDKGVDGVERKHGSPFSFKTIKPPSFKGIDSIMNWLETKVGGSADMSMAYAVGVSVKKKGIEPKNITERILEGGLLDRIEEAYVDAIEKNILNSIG